MRAALKSAPSIGVKVTSTGIQPSATSALTLKNTFAGGKARLDELLDVDLTLQANGSVPVYNSQTDKYEVKPLDITINNVDGGSF